MKKKKKEIDVRVNFVEAPKELKSFTSFTKWGQLIVTDMEDFILIQSNRLDDNIGRLSTFQFLISKEGAKNLVSHLNKILESEWGHCHLCCG